MTPEEKKEYMKEYRIKNAEKLKVKNKAYYEKNAEKRKAQQRVYNIKNAEDHKAYHKVWRTENPEKLKAQHRVYYIKNAETLKLKNKAWIEANPEKYKKCNIISHWKHRGLICDDYDKLYEAYLQSPNCEECGCEYSEHGNGVGRFKCMDHCHTTGLFRNFLCCTCNVRRG